MHRLRVKIETSGLVSIDSDVQYSFRAGEEIILTHGFSTGEGSEFVAEIVSVIDCGQPDEEISDYGVAFDEIQYLSAQKAKQLSEFEVYPNPVEDILQVSFNVEKHEFIKIAIQDRGDGSWDSYLIVREGAINSNFELDEISYSPEGPYCEGDQITLSINNNPNYSYLWSTGQTTSTITVNTSVANNPYWVKVSNNIDCEITREIELDLYTNQNQPPFLSGVNGTNENCVMTRVGEEVCFTINATDPQLNEKVKITSAPTNLTIWNTLDLNKRYDEEYQNPTYGICWTPSIHEVGVFNFSLTVSDNNFCGALTTTRDYCIKVVCPNCPYDWDKKYQNMSIQMNNPLPSETVSPVSIETGYNIIPNQAQGNVVISSSENVLFRAGKEIILNDFLTEDGAIFEALIDPTTCLDFENECNCCHEWDGFQIYIPNIFTPDGDGANDVWRIIDPRNNPKCLFDADLVNVQIFNRFSDKVFEGSVGSPGFCCSIYAANVENIYWNGRLNNTGNELPSGVYYVVVTINGCGAQEYTYNGTITLMR